MDKYLLVLFVVTTHVLTISSLRDYSFVIENGAQLPQATDVGIEWEYTALASEQDDYPYSLLSNSIAFDFPFFGTNVDRITANPNGALMFGNKNPCSGNYFWSSNANNPCTFDSTYDNLIAIYLTDLNPQVQGNVTWLATDDAYTVQYDKVPFFYLSSAPDDDLYHRFYVSLFPNGRIEIGWLEVTDPLNVGYWTNPTSTPRVIMSGLRAPSSFSSIDSDNADDWGTTKNGIYPPKSEVFNLNDGDNGHSTVTYWPIGSEACVTPTVSPANGNMTARIYLTHPGSGPVDLDIYCRFTPSPTNESYVLVNSSFLDVNITYNYEDDGTYSCDLPAYDELFLEPESVPSDWSLWRVLLQIVIHEQVRPHVPEVMHRRPLPLTDMYITYLPDSDPMFNLTNRPNLFTERHKCTNCEHMMTTCVKDCHGTFFGTASLDDCSVCSGGYSGHEYNSDIDCIPHSCFGYFSTFSTISGDACGCSSTLHNYTECEASSQSVSDASPPANYFSDMTYVYATFPGMTDSSSSWEVAGDNNWVDFDTNAGNSDPSTFLQLVTLPFSVHWFGDERSFVYLSASGAIYFSDMDIECSDKGAAKLWTDAKGDCPYSFVAASLTDYMPANIARYSLSNSALHVEWQMTLQYNESQPISANQQVIHHVRASIYKSGKIAIQLLNISDPVDYDYATSQNWVVGLHRESQTYISTDIPRDPPFDPNYANQRQFFEDTEPTLPTSITGIYPFRSSLVSDTVVEFCSISSTFCMTPTYGPANIIGGRVFLSAEDWGLIPHWSSIDSNLLTCLFGSISSPGKYNFTTNAIECEVPSMPASSIVRVTLAIQGQQLQGTGVQFYSYQDLSVNETNNESIEHHCDICQSVNSHCIDDCNGDWFGWASIDTCNVCAGGHTGLVPNADRDCMDTCFGSYSLDSQGLCSCTGIDRSTCKQSDILDPPTTPPQTYQYIRAPVLTSGIVEPSNTGFSTINFGDADFFQKVDLPFFFPFFDEWHSSLYLTKEGSLFLSTEDDPDLDEFQECVLEFFSPSPSNTCDYRVIAPSFTMYMSLYGNVSISTTSTSATIHWQDMVVKGSLIPPPSTHSFSATVTVDGLISFEYYTITDPFNTHNSNNWFVGLVNTHLVITNPFVTSALISWTNSSVPEDDSIYADRTEIVSGSRTDFCFFSQDACIHPSFGPSEGNTKVRISLSNWGDQCINQAALLTNLACDFGGLTTSGNYNETLGVLECYSPSGLDNTTVIVQMTMNGVVIPTSNTMHFSYDPNITSSDMLPFDTTSSLCEACNDYLSELNCFIDCAGDFLGTAYYDSCNICSGGTSGHPADQESDCMNVCEGTFLEIDSGAGTQCVCSGDASNYDSSSTCTVPQQVITNINKQYMVDIENNAVTSVLTLSNQTGSSRWIYLGFSVSLFGMNPVSELFISRYGAISTTPSSSYSSPIWTFDDCVAAFLTLDDTTAAMGQIRDSCEYNIIAPSLAQYRDDAGRISFEATTSSLTILWKDMQLISQTLDQGPFHTFSVTLFDNGAIDFTYYNISDPADVGDDLWFVGLMKDSSSLYTDDVSRYRMASEWWTELSSRVNQYSYSGSESALFMRAAIAYLMRGSIVSDTIVHFCPVGTDFCVAPVRGVDSGSSWVRVANSDWGNCIAPGTTAQSASTASSSFVSTLECDFGGVRTSAAYNITTDTLDCLSPIGPTDASMAFSIQGGSSPQYFPILSKTQFRYNYFDDVTYTYTDAEADGNLRTLCEICNSLISSDFCVQDCAGQYLGQAYYDSCSQCSGGTSGHIEDSDIDCLGVCFGSYEVDSSGLCSCDESDIDICKESPNNDEVSFEKLNEQYLVSFQPAASLKPILGKSSSLHTQARKVFPSWKTMTKATMVESDQDDNKGRKTSRSHAPQSSITQVTLALGNDDMQRVNLDFSFPFFGTQYRRVYINSNGALLLKNMSDICISKGLESFFINQSSDPAFSTSSFDCRQFLLIAGSLTDYDPSLDAATSITYSSSEDSFSVSYQDMKLAYDASYSGDTSTSHSFSIEIFKTGKIVFIHDQISDPVLVPGWSGDFDDSNSSRHWLVGIWQGYAPSTSDQVTASSTEWGGPFSWLDGGGALASRSSISSGNAFLFCSVPTTLCMYPTVGSVSGGDIVHLGSSDLWDCIHDYSIACDFGGIATPAVYNFTTRTFDCASPVGVAGTNVRVELTADGMTLATKEINLFTYVVSSSSTDLSDYCRECQASSPEFCYQDCNGDWLGSAVYDTCQECVGGLTGKTSGSSRDCEDVCYGPFQALSGSDLQTGGESCGCNVNNDNPLCSFHIKITGDTLIEETLYAVDHYYWVFLVVSFLISLAGLVINLKYRMPIGHQHPPANELPFYQVDVSNLDDEEDSDEPSSIDSVTPVPQRERERERERRRREIRGRSDRSSRSRGRGSRARDNNHSSRRQDRYLVSPGRIEEEEEEEEEEEGEGGERKNGNRRRRRRRSTRSGRRRDYQQVNDHTPVANRAGRDEKNRNRGNRDRRSHREQKSSRRHNADRKQQEDDNNNRNTNDNNNHNNGEQKQRNQRPNRTPQVMHFSSSSDSSDLSSSSSSSMETRRRDRPNRNRGDNDSGNNSNNNNDDNRNNNISNSRNNNNNNNNTNNMTRSLRSGRRRLSDASVSSISSMDSDDTDMQIAMALSLSTAPTALAPLSQTPSETIGMPHIRFHGDVLPPTPYGPPPSAPEERKRSNDSKAPSNRTGDDERKRRKRREKARGRDRRGRDRYRDRDKDRDRDRDRDRDKPRRGNDRARGRRGNGERQENKNRDRGERKERGRRRRKQEQENDDY